jgi:hypothetical protein
MSSSLCSLRSVQQVRTQMAYFDRMLKKAHLFVALDRLTELRVRGCVFVLASEFSTTFHGYDHQNSASHLRRF